MRRGLIVVLSVLLLARSARADDGSSEEEARAAMRRGVAAFGRGDADKALEEYEAAKRLVPNANAPFLYAAEALVALGRYPEAVANLEHYLAKSPDVSDRDDVKSRIARLKAEHYPGRVRIVANVADAAVNVDGEPRGTARVLEILPGKHRVELRAPSHGAVAQDVDVVGDRDATLSFTLPEEAHAEPPPTPPPATVESTIPWRTAGWITTGVGATTLVVTFLVDAVALGPKISDYRAAAARGDASARALHDDAVGLRGLTVAGYVTGGVISAAGVGLILFAPHTTRTTAITPWLTPTSAGVGFRSAL